MGGIRLKKSCFLTTYGGESDIFKLIDRAKADGFEAVEPIDLISFYEADGIDTIKRAREKLEEYGMTCSCFSKELNVLDHPNPVETLKKCVDMAAAFGSPYLHHTFYLPMRFDKVHVYQNVEPIFVEIAKEVAEYAGEKGIECIYEDQGYHLNTPERFDSLISKIGLDNIGVCLDVGNSLFYEIEPEEFAGKFISLIKHVHVKDFLKKETCPGYAHEWHRSIQGNYLYQCPIGHGVINFEKIFNILLSAGYDGYYSLEGAGMDDQNKGVRISMNNLQYAFDCATGIFTR